MEIGKKEKSPEVWKEHKKSRKNSKRSLSKGKQQKECASDLNDPKHQNEIFANNKADGKRKDITGSHCLKVVSGKVIVDEKEIKDSWKEYIENLMNEENECYHRISAVVKEGPADCTRIDEVAAALKKMKRHKP